MHIPNAVHQTVVRSAAVANLLPYYWRIFIALNEWFFGDLSFTFVTQDRKIFHGSMSNANKIKVKPATKDFV